MKSYALKGQPFEKLVHIDAYRLSDAGEFAALNPASFLMDTGALVVIEWPERIEGALPVPDVALALSSQDATSEERYIEGA
jgi:tRNA threonylcarbamoyladenosine biosynthesis protein TsaE